MRHRLREECCVSWGKALDIAKKTGFSAAHISNVQDAHRNGAMASPWRWQATGVSPYSELEQLALEYHALRALQMPAPAVEHALPQLDATLAYCRANPYPVSFLQQYRAEAVKVAVDRPREVWLADLQVKFWEWKYSTKQ